MRRLAAVEVLDVGARRTSMGYIARTVSRQVTSLLELGGCGRVVIQCRITHATVCDPCTAGILRACPSSSWERAPSPHFQKTAIAIGVHIFVLGDNPPLQREVAECVGNINAAKA